MIEAFDTAGTSLSSFTRDGISGSGRLGDNSATFIEVLSDSADITKVTLSIQSNIPGNINSSFAVNRISLNSPVTTVPTPALLLGLIGLGAAAIRKRKQDKVEAKSNG